MKTRTFDEQFDAGDDISAALDLSQARRPNKELLNVTVELPTWMVQALDREARRLGVTRQTVIKVWVAERCAQVDSPTSSDLR